MINVTLRKKEISKGRHSLYLDFYPAIRIPNSTKTTRREFLGMYILDKPKTEWDKQLNKEILQKADIIRVERIKSILNDQFGFLDKKKLDGDFLKFYEKNSTLSNLSSFKHFKKFVEGKCTFGDINVALCESFKEYLLNANSLKNANSKVCQNTASSYYNTFSAMLKIAYKEKILSEKIDEELDPIPTKDTHREHLNIQELKQLYNTPCEEPILKQASLFSSVTGLRVGDILKLDWSEVIENSNGDFTLKFITDKGKKLVYLPLSKLALEILGERKEGRVFKDLTKSMTNLPLKKWIKQANIHKDKFSFHCLRHSFASILNDKDVNALTLRDLLAHSSINTTLIYTHVENPKMREAVNKITI